MRKKIVLAFFILGLFTANSNAQQIGINEDGSLPNTNAILDIKSFKKGVLIPRMSTADRLAIPHTTGLLVYDTTTHSFWYNTGIAWQNLSAGSSAIGTWLLTGNAGNTDSNFIGTVDNTPFRVRINNQPSGMITYNGGNTFLGYHSGLVNPPAYGYYNTGYGTFSLKRNTTGSFNTAIGNAAMQGNITGSKNTAVGNEALSLNISGNENTAIGRNALTFNNGSGNTANGSHAMYANTTGYDNAAYGINAMYENTTGSQNTAIGSHSLRNNTAAHSNTAIGSYALYYNTSSLNTATGASALLYNTNGTDNTANGQGALLSNTTGSYNTALGTGALRNGQTGLYNTAVGAYTLQPLIVGARNTTIGAFANVLTGANTINAMALGYGAFADASNKVRIGNAAVTRIEGQVPFTTPSDGRFKYKVQEDVKGLDFVLQLRPVTYNFDTKRFDEQLSSRQKDSVAVPVDDIMEAAYIEASSIRRSGFIAQEVEKAAAASGYNFSGIIKPRNDQEHYSLSYESFVVPMVKAIQELNKKLDEVKAENESLRKEIKQLQKSK